MKILAFICVLTLMLSCARTPASKDKRKPVTEKTVSQLDVVHAEFPNARILGTDKNYKFIVIDGPRVYMVEMTCGCGGRNPKIESRNLLPVYYEATRDTSQLR